MKYRINFNLFLFFLLIGIIIFSLFYGAVKVPVFDVIKIILNKIKQLYMNRLNIFYNINWYSFNTVSISFAVEIDWKEYCVML